MPSLLHSTHLDRLCVEALLDSGLYSEAVVGVRGATGWSWGRSDPALDAAGDSFDLASLTKPLVSKIALELDASGELPLATPVRAVWPEAPTSAALADLLAHRGGLVAWWPLYRRDTAFLAGGPAAPRSDRVAEVLESLVEPARWSAAVGTYSDLGLILWGLVVERATQASLPEHWQRVVSSLDSSTSARVRFREEAPVAGARPCRCDTAKEQELARGLDLDLPRLPAPAPGDVQDGNARWLGPSGHAGLFGTLEGVCALVDRWLRSPGDRRRARLEGDGPPLGWRRGGRHTSAGPCASGHAFGHVGFTGGSIWMDPATGRAVVLLGHRADPSSDLGEARRSVANAAFCPGAGC